MKQLFFLPLFFLFSFCLASATYYYEPMNFGLENGSTHSMVVNTPGFIEVNLPTNFTVTSGSTSGNNNVSFTFTSPDNISTSRLFVGEILVDSVLEETFYLLSVDDVDIVDIKIEIGHGDFNYIDNIGVIGDDDYLLFNIVRVWAVGSDILGEPASNVRFNCTFPNIIPRTVDSKYTTIYNSTNIQAQGLLSRMEGMSLFRIFVLSQPINQYSVGDEYFVECDTLHYDFTNTKVIANIPNINLTIVDVEPFNITMINGDGYTTYIISNNAEYDTKDIEFLWSIGTNTLRQKKDFLRVGESVSYNVATNESGTINFKTTFIPQWMFNSRSPTTYTQESFDTYVTTNVFYNINMSEWFSNVSFTPSSILYSKSTNNFFTVLQSPPYSGGFKVRYDYYNEENVLSYTDEYVVSGVIGEYEIKIYPDAQPSSLVEGFTVMVTFSMKDNTGEWQELPSINSGVLDINKLTTGAPITNVLTGGVVQEPTPINNTVEKISAQIKRNINWFYLLGLTTAIIILLLLLGSKKHKNKKKDITPVPHERRA